MDAVLARLGRIAGISLLFDAPPIVRQYRFDPGYGLDGSLQEIIDNLGRQELIWKRHGSIYLFRRQDWAVCNREGLIPWQLIKDLRAGAAANGGYLRPQDWLRLSGLKREQLESLDEEFPDAVSVRKLQSVLRLVAELNEREQRAAGKPTGADWDDWSPETRRRLGVLFSPDDARRTRLVFRWDPLSRPPKLTIYFGQALPPLTPREIAFTPRRVQPIEGGR